MKVGRTPGVVRLRDDAHDRALFRHPSSPGPGRGQAARQPRLPCNPVHLGRQTVDKLERFRAFGGAQSYPSRTKDSEDVDFSTGSVGLGVAITLFASLVQDLLRLKQLVPDEGPPGRMIALAGDAELDEGNVFEALLEGWKHDVRNVWWIIDYNRQSLDSVVEDRLFHRIDNTFQSMGWDVVTLKYGRRLQEVFCPARRRGLADLDRQLLPTRCIRPWSIAAAAGWRARLKRDLGSTHGIAALLDEYDDVELHGLMTNLAGHDMESVLGAFHAVDTDAPKCFIAYTIKGFGLPFAGHKDNHAGLMSAEQMEVYRRSQRIEPGQEYDLFAGLDVSAEEIRRFLDQVPFTARTGRRHDPPRLAVPEVLAVPQGSRMSTQEGFGRLLGDLVGIRGDSPDGS